tara:strand:- start:275508 stop:276044 length:537 start_codon:yes stop_codon:yes gene_type:complete
MKVIKTDIEDVLIIEPKLFGDKRGFFMETFSAERYRKMAGIDTDFVQDNHSRSQRGVLRGLHFQKSNPQGKLVRVVGGEVFDVAVDIRKNSKSYGNWIGVILSAENKRQLWVPPGFAHGFVTLSETADFEYKCTEYYNPEDEGCLAWNDDTVGIDWPIKNPTLSEKDALGISLKEISK